MAQAKAGLQSLGAGVLGAPESGDPAETQIRAAATAATARLEERRRTGKPPVKIGHGKTMTAAERGRVLARLEQQIGQMERRLAKVLPPLQQKELRQKLSTAKNLRQQLKQQGRSRTPHP